MLTTSRSDRTVPALIRLLPVALLAITGAPAVAEDAPAEITSDSLAYCLQLHDRVEQLRQAAPLPPSPTVIELSTEGARMCNGGQARGGVMRLRQAIYLMTHTDDAR
jgi:hypothetical protein